MRHETRVCGSRSSERAEGSDVTLGFVLMSYYLSHADHAPLASFRLGSSVKIVKYGRLGSLVRVVRYGRALREVKEVLAKSRRNPDEIALHSLRIGGAAAIAVGRDVLEGVIKREGRWKSDTYETYTRESVEVARRVCGEPVVASGLMERQPGEGTIWGRKR